MPSRLRWWRIAAAVLLVGYALAMGVVTITVTAHDKDPYAAMQTSGSCAILVALGLASARALAPEAPLGRLPGRRSVRASPATWRRTTPGAGRTCSVACWRR